MNKILFVFATLVVLSFAQEVEIAVEPVGDQELGTLEGEVVTENIEIEVSTVIPPQEELEAETILNIGEVVNVEQTVQPVQEVTVEDENIVVEETIVVEDQQPNLEDVTIVEETVVTQPGDGGETLVSVGEVDTVQQEQPDVEDVTIVQENVIFEENVIVETLPPDVQTVAVVEENVIVQEGDGPETTIIIESVIINEEQIFTGWNLEEGEDLDLEGSVQGSVSGSVTVNGWSVNGVSSAKLVTIPVALVFAAVGLIFTS